MFFLPSGRSTDLSKSNSASAWMTAVWRTGAGAGRAAGAGAGAAGAGAGAGLAGAAGGGGFGPAHSGSTCPEVTTQAPEPSFTAAPELSCRFGVTLANAEPAASAKVAANPSVSLPSEEIFIFGTP